MGTGTLVPLSEAARAMPDPLFVMCEARTGSTLLRFLLDAHQDVACPGETNIPAICHELVNTWSLATGYPSPDRRPPGELPLLPGPVLDGMRASVGLIMSAHLERVGKTWFCDKSLGSAPYAKLLLQLYPRTKFVCLYRHPMDVIASGLEACPWGLIGYGFDSYIAASPGNSVLALARFWLERTAQIMSVEEDFPGQCLRVRYEDLVSEPDRVMREVFDHLGVPRAPDIVARCFRSEPENLGAGDYKIWYTSEITSDSVGRGWTVPANLIGQPIVEAMNELSARLGYLPVLPEAWGAGTPPPDVRLPMAGSAPGRVQRSVGQGAGGGEAAVVAGALRERIGTALGERSLTAACRGGSTADAFRLAVFPDESQSRTELPALLAVDLSEGAAEIIDPFAAGAGRPLSQSWELLGSAETWRRVLEGEVNLGVALRRNELRYRPEATADDARDEFGRTGSEPIEAGRPIMRTEVHRRMMVVSQLLGATYWQPG
jgi:protein-tyrosine sulfotransferase